VQALADACTHPAAGAYVLLAAYTGIRRGHLLRLTAHDVQGEFIRLDRSSKTRTLQLVPLHPKVQEIASRAATKFPNDLDMQLLLAQSYRKSGQLQQALEHGRRAIAIDPKSTNAVVLTMYTLNDMKQKDSATAVAQRAIAAGVSKDTIGALLLSDVPPLVKTAQESRKREDWQAALDGALGKLVRLRPEGKQLVVHALTRAIAADGKVTVAESELLRVACATLGCPLPPLLADEATPRDRA